MTNQFGSKMIVVALLLAAIVLRSGDKTRQAEANNLYAYYHPPLIREINGRYSMFGLASWYSKQSPGIKRRTANNEVFNDRAMTCAMWGVAFDRRIKVTNLQNGRSVILRVNDRGPHERHVREGRIVDLTHAAFEQLSDAREGVLQIKIEFL